MLLVCIFLIILKKIITMKHIISISVLVLLFICSSQLSAQTSASTPETLDVKVFFHCANGKALLENRLGALRGISSAVADIETKIVTVVYDPAVITRDKILEMIEQIGYRTEFSDPDKPIKKACNHDEEGTDHHEHNN
jgi:periplasmic mercuric ion binding protein